jgi:hypothetical protein
MSSVIAGPSIYKQPAALRFEVFTCGAILGRSGHRLVLHMIGAVTHNRKPLFVNLLATTRFELFFAGSIRAILPAVMECPALKSSWPVTLKSIRESGLYMSFALRDRTSRASWV